MGVPARFYRSFARYLAKRSVSVVLFDFRGIGWSRVDDLSALKADASIWGRCDLAAAIDQAVLQSDGQPVIGIGHSLGGGLLGFADNVSKLHKMIHICSQSGYYGLHPLKTRLYLLFHIHLTMPLLTRLLGYYPAHWLSGSEALPSGFVAEWSTWCLHRQYFMDERFKVKSMAHHADYTGPLLSLSFDDDFYAIRQSVDKMASYYPNSQLERRHLRPSDCATEALGHFEVFKPSNGRWIWNMITDWSQTLG
jgi:predicted alpha/beta hydrolase